MSVRRAALVALMTSAIANSGFAGPARTPSGAPVEVVVLGTYHFGNPGLDIANMQVDDVLAPKRQAEIGEVLDDLARYAPTRILVEARTRVPGTDFSANYRKFARGELVADRNEVTQLGFRLAQRLHHQEVYAVDVEGEFPFDAVMAWVQKAGLAPQLEARVGQIQARVAETSGQLATHTVGQVLRLFNDPRSIAADHAFYLDTLQYGAGEEQPGAALVASWYERNIRICARIVQAARPGDRLLVLYGSGHAYLLRDCLGSVTGFRLIEVNDFLRAH